jgi:hypothetical protein
MRKNTLLSIIIVTLSIIFVSCSSEGNSYSEKTLVDDLVEKNLLVIIGEFSEDAPKHTLVKLQGNSNRGEMYTNLSHETKFSYEFEYDKEGKTWYLGVSINGGSPFYVSLYKECAEEGKCIFLGRDIRSGKVVRTFIPMPAGYEHIIKARNLAVAGGDSSKLIAKNCKEAIKKASAENGDYSRFVKIKAARILLEKAQENSDFLLARSVFKEFGMEGNVAQAEILFIAKGEAVAAENINQTAKLAWESIWADKNSAVYSLERAFLVAEAISFACAKVGNYNLAIKYYRDVTDAVLYRKLTDREESNGLEINKKVFSETLQAYEMQKMPAAFVTTVLNNKKE